MEFSFLARDGRVACAAADHHPPDPGRSGFSTRAWAAVAMATMRTRTDGAPEATVLPKAAGRMTCGKGMRGKWRTSRLPLEDLPAG
jgi:hypothetical protein